MNSYPPFSHDSASPSDHGARTDRPRRAPRVLVVDDESDLRELLEITLIGMGLDVDCAAELAQARRLLQAHRYALCLTDMRLPDGDGMELVSEIVREHAHTPVAMITAYGSTETAVSALKAGAFDFVTKPLALDALRALVRSALHLNGVAGLSTPAALAGPTNGAPRAASASSPTNASSAGALTDPGVPLVDGASAASGDVEGGLIGDSAVMQALRQSIDRLARSMAPVAITGESGSGKELAARLIHQRSGRSAQPFIAVNCGAIPESLMEAEFFGYRRGAFTGADADRQGFFQAAHGGTLFSTRWPTCLWPCRSSCFVPFRSARSAGLGPTRKNRWMCAS